MTLKQIVTCRLEGGFRVEDIAVSCGVPVQEVREIVAALRADCTIPMIFQRGSK